MAVPENEVETVIQAVGEGVTDAKITETSQDSETKEKEGKEKVPKKKRERKERKAKVTAALESHPSLDEDMKLFVHLYRLREDVFMELPACSTSKRFFRGGFLASTLLYDRNLPDLTDIKKVTEFAQGLLDKNMMHPLTSDTPRAFNVGFKYRFQMDLPCSVLNMKKLWNAPPRPPALVAADLRRQLMACYGRFLGVDGVDYEALAESHDFAKYVLATSELQTVDITQFTHDEALSFFINIYNSAAIHGFVEKGLPQNMFQRYLFFTRTGYNIGGHKFTLEDLENGVLRCNKRPLTGFFPRFKGGDPRRQFSFKNENFDCRIHFALNCGAKSCPPIKVYRPETVQANLTTAAKSFCNQEVVIDLPTKTVTLSSIMKWFRCDFGKDHAEMLEKLSDFVTEEKKHILVSIPMTQWAVKFKKYDWHTNESKPYSYGKRNVRRIIPEEILVPESSVNAPGAA